MTESERLNLLFSLDKNYLDIFFGCLYSILQNGGEHFYHVYILHSDLEQEDQIQIQTLFPAIEFTFLFVDPKLFDGFPQSDRYPLQIYYRLAAALLIKDDIERILYLDGDTIILNPLDELYNQDFEGNYIAACSHTGYILDSFNQIRLKMDEMVSYINSGVMLYNMPLVKKHFSIPKIQQFAKANEYRLFLPDQDIITALYGHKIKELDFLKYNLGEKGLRHNNISPLKETIDLDWIEKNTVIIHYYGKNKPWKENYYGYLDYFYNKIVRQIHLICIIDPQHKAESTARDCAKELPFCLYLNGKWCWYSHPMLKTNKTKKMAVQNISNVLNHAIETRCYKNIVFYWDEKEEAFLKDILKPLIQDNVQLSLVVMQNKNIPGNHLYDLEKILQSLNKYEKLRTLGMEPNNVSSKQILKCLKETFPKQEMS